jgi:hypothetical protein
MAESIVKKVIDFSLPSRDLTKLSLAGENLVSYISAGDGKIAITFFYSVGVLTRD